LMMLERFVRIVVRGSPVEDQTLRPMLDWAVRRGRLRLPWDNQKEGIQKVCDIRNTILHGNYEQAAAQAKTDVRAFFKSQFAGEIAGMTKVLNYLVEQVDARTGE